MIISTIFRKEEVEGKARFFAALGDPTTLKILKVLFKNHMICVSDISKKTQKSVSAVSHQLKKLRNLGLVESKRDGKMICYILADANKLKFLREFI